MIRTFIAAICLLTLLAGCKMTVETPTADVSSAVVLSPLPSPVPPPPTATPLPPTPTPAPPTPPSMPITLSLLHTNDTWGFVLPCG